MTDIKPILDSIYAVYKAVTFEECDECGTTSYDNFLKLLFEDNEKLQDEVYSKIDGFYYSPEFISSVKEYIVPLISAKKLLKTFLGIVLKTGKNSFRIDNDCIIEFIKGLRQIKCPYSTLDLINYDGDNEGDFSAYKDLKHFFIFLFKIFENFKRDKTAMAYFLNACMGGFTNVES